LTQVGAASVLAVSTPADSSYSGLEDELKEKIKDASWPDKAKTTAKFCVAKAAKDAIARPKK
jgi:hypothetical protein